MTTWNLPLDHRQWLNAETNRLIDFTEGSVHPAGGFAWLNGDGSADLDRPVESWISTRMTHVLAIGHLLGRPSCGPLVDHGISALQTVLHDAENGGWYAATDKPNGGEKRAYEHAFVILAATSATLAQRSGARELLNNALEVMASRFWDDARGVVVDVWNRDWTEREPYGGANANMHTVEAFLAASDVTGDRVWLDRALRIADFFLNQHARSHSWRIPEHFDGDWNELPEYNLADPAHRFRPYGATIGHSFEWSRLALHLNAALNSRTGGSAPDWLEEVAKELFNRAVIDGWQSDGFVYTTDWEGTPVVKDRLHWVVCEAIAAASALQRQTSQPSLLTTTMATGESLTYEHQYRAWWELADRSFIDRANGSWHAQLDENNQPATTVWSGKPDTYHAIQATLIPRLPLAVSIACAITLGLLDQP